ncbi:hypothetical protein Tco_0400737 [Tanacetum coccineum]
MISLESDGVVRVLSPVTAAEIQASDFEQVIQGGSKTIPSSAQNVLLFTKAKVALIRLMTVIPEHTVLALFYSQPIFLKKKSCWFLLMKCNLFPLAKQQVFRLYFEDMEQIDDVAIAEMDINWQIQ